MSAAATRLDAPITVSQVVSPARSIATKIAGSRGIDLIPAHHFITVAWGFCRRRAYSHGVTPIWSRAATNTSAFMYAVIIRALQIFYGKDRGRGVAASLVVRVTRNARPRG